jgi:hypothetical protein
MDIQPDGVTGILELKDAQDIGDDMELCADDVTSDASGTPLNPGGGIPWNDPVVAVPTANGVMQSG